MQLCLNLPQLALPIGTRVLILEGEHRGKTGRVFETINTLHLINLKGCRTTLHRNKITPNGSRSHKNKEIVKQLKEVAHQLK